MNRLKAVAKLTRIEHSLMLAIAVIAAELIVGVLPSFYVLVLSVLTPILVSMGSFAINDYYDVDADRANRRTDRPIVSGAIKKQHALWIAIICLVLGVIISIFINIAVFLIAIVFAALAVLYSYKLKDIVLLGNCYIAFSMVIPFIYGDYVVSSRLATPIILVGIMIFLAGLGREIHGMIRDYGGDTKARKSRNLIYHVGPVRASQLAFILYAEAILVSVYMAFFTIPFAFNLAYIIPVAVTDIILASVGAAHLFQKGSKNFYKFSRNASLAAMGLALIGFLIAALVYIHI